MKRNPLNWLCAVAMLMLGACGGSTPPPEEPAAPPPPPPVAEEPKPAPPEKAADEEKDSEKAEAEDQDEPRSRRPKATFFDPAEPVTIGLDGAVFRLEGGAELRIPSGAMTNPRNVLFSVNKKARGTTGKIGDVYLIQLTIPNTQIDLAQARASSPIDSSSEPFVIKLPIPFNGSSGNLAVETVSVDKGKAKSQWSVIAQTKLETADDGNKAVFEVQQLPDGSVHLTTSAPN